MITHFPTEHQLWTYTVFEHIISNNIVILFSKQLSLHRTVKLSSAPCCHDCITWSQLHMQTVNLLFCHIPKVFYLNSGDQDFSKCCMLSLPSSSCCVNKWIMELIFILLGSWCSPCKLLWDITMVLECTGGSCLQRPLWGSVVKLQCRKYITSSYMFQNKTIIYQDFLFILLVFSICIRNYYGIPFPDVGRLKTPLF